MTLCRCKKIGEAGSQQLLLDTQAIKGLLLEFPSAGKAFIYTNANILSRLLLAWLNYALNIQARALLSSAGYSAGRD